MTRAAPGPLSRETLEELDYWIFAQVIDAAAYVPQHRERVYIVCFDKKEFPEKPPFVFPPKPEGNKPQLKDILETEPGPQIHAYSASVGLSATLCGGAQGEGQRLWLRSYHS